MRRNFKIDGTSFRIVNRFTDCEVNEFNPRYDVMKLSAYYNAWIRIGSCMTLAEGREVAESAIA